MNKLKMEFDRDLKDTKRPGIEGLIIEMENGGFYDAPCSSRFHLCEEGGLLQHSMNVLEYARKLNETWGRIVPDDSLVIACLLHDLGKMGDHGKQNYVENILKGGVRSTAKPWVTNPDLAYIDHEIRSVIIANRHISLTEDEENAILWHNGLYGKFGRDIQGHETPLYLVLHFSDMWCSRVFEVDENEGKEET